MYEVAACLRPSGTQSAVHAVRQRSSARSTTAAPSDRRRLQSKLIETSWPSDAARRIGQTSGQFA